MPKPKASPEPKAQPQPKEAPAVASSQSPSQQAEPTTAAGPAAPPAAQEGSMSKGVAALISLFLPGVGLALRNPKCKLEGIAVFVAAIGLDALVALLSLGGTFIGGPLIGAILGNLTGGLCCIATPIISIISAFGMLLIPLVHVIGAMHTYMRG